MNWYKKAKKEKCKGWMAVNLNSFLSNKIQKWGKDNIPDEDLTEDGRETDTHITLCYGICLYNEDIIKALLKEQKPIEAKLKEVSFFAKNKDFDVVIIKIESSDLEKLNNKICQELRIENSFNEYKPHCTIAYVKKGKARKYINNNFISGEKIIFKEILFKDKNNKETIIKLNK